MDGRRTPGFIEAYDNESAMFIWRITASEDAGKCWEIPAEQINCYQFRKGCPLLTPEEVSRISERIQQFSQVLTIPKSAETSALTEKSITERELTAHDWIIRNSVFYKSGGQFDFQAKEGEEPLYADLEHYLREAGLHS